MAGRKTCFVQQNEIVHMLEKSGSEGDYVFAESESSSSSERECESDLEESAV
jgi:hypothetical protein